MALVDVSHNLQQPENYMYKLLSLKRYSGLRADSILVGFYFFEMKIQRQDSALCFREAKGT